MSSGCGDVLSLADLQTAKKHQIFEAEVITGKSGGVAGGADIDYATNQVTGQTQKTVPKVISDIGIERIGDFTNGGTVTARNQGMLEEGGSVYTWRGSLPKVVPAGSTPQSTGGIYPNGDWIDVGDATIRSVLNGPDGTGLSYFFGGGGWTGENAAGANIYDNDTITYNNALRQRFSIPDTANPLPIEWVEKVTSATREDEVERWEQGCSYHSLTKVSGSAYGATDTSVATHSSGTGQLIAKHMRGESRHSNAETWGGWSYGAVLGEAIDTGAKSTIAHEFNLNNRGPDMGWMQNAVDGSTRGLVCVTQDNSNPVTQMLVIGRGSAAPNGYIWTGALFRANSFVAPTEPLTEVGNGEAIRLEGSSVLLASNGIRFRGGAFRTGISLTESTFSSNCAILLGDNQRITVGTGPANTTYLAFNRSEGWVDFSNLNIRLNGTKILGPRVTGINQLTGTADGVSKNTETVTLQELARYVKKVTDALIAHGIMGPS